MPIKTNNSEIIRQLYNIDMAIDEMKRLAKVHTIGSSRARSKCRNFLEKDRYGWAFEYAVRAINHNENLEICQNAAVKLRQILKLFRNSINKKSLKEDLQKFIFNVDQAVRNNDLFIIKEVISQYSKQFKQQTPNLNTEDITSETAIDVFEDVFEDGVKMKIDDLMLNLIEEVITERNYDDNTSYDYVTPITVPSLVLAKAKREHTKLKSSSLIKSTNS